MFINYGMKNKEFKSVDAEVHNARKWGDGTFAVAMELALEMAAEL